MAVLLPPSPQTKSAPVVAFNGDDIESCCIKKPLLHEHVHHEDAAHLLYANKLEAQLHPFKGSSFSRTCLNVTNALSGVGVLSMPYALSEGGWLSLALFLVAGIVCCYTGILIERCMDADPCIKSYPDIGQYAFGSKGRIAIAIFMYLELYLVAVGFLILAGDNLDKLFPDATLELATLRIQGKQLFVLLASLIILPTTWLRDLSALAYVSASGLLASMILLGALLWAGIAETGFSKTGRLLNLSGLPTAMGLYFVCFTGHAIFPTIHASMKDSRQFSKVLFISYTLSTLNYGLTAILGYLMYGEDLQSQVTLNLPVGKPYSSIAIYTTLINPFAKYALLVTPVANAMEERLPFHGSSFASFLIRTLLLISTTLIALAVPFFGSLMSFIGSFLSIMATVLFPCLCYLKIFRASRRLSIELVVIIGILVVGILIGTMGTYSSLQQILCNS